MQDVQILLDAPKLADSESRPVMDAIIAMHTV